MGGGWGDCWWVLGGDLEACLWCFGRFSGSKPGRKKQIKQICVFSDVICFHTSLCPVLSYGVPCCPKLESWTNASADENDSEKPSPLGGGE